MFSDNPLLLSKTETKEEAFMISSNWKKYNRITDYEDIDQIRNRKLFLYRSSSDVKVKKYVNDVKDVIFSYALKYKKDKEEVFLAIAPL
jgi:hypothetical protein